MTKPPLGRRRELHQAWSGTGRCRYCHKPMDDWEPMQECEALVTPVKKEDNGRSNL